MTHYKMNRLHLGCGESLSTYYRRSETVVKQEQDRSRSTTTNRKTKTTRQCRES